MSVVQAENPIGHFNISSSLFPVVRQHSSFDHSWKFTWQLYCFVENVFSSQAIDPNEKLSMEIHSKAKWK